MAGHAPAISFLATAMGSGLPERIARHDEYQDADQHHGLAVFDGHLDMMRLYPHAFARPLPLPGGLRPALYLAGGLPDLGGSVRSS